MTFEDGSTTSLTPNFTLTTTAGIDYRTGSATDAYGLSGDSTNSLSVVFKDGSTLLFDLTRDENTAMFDFTNVTGTGTATRLFTVGSGVDTVNFGVSNNISGQQIINVDKWYMIADGLTKQEADDGMANFKPLDPIEGFRVLQNTAGDWQLWTYASFSSPYDYLFHDNINTENASDALNDFVSDTTIVSAAESAAILANANAVTAEYYASRGVVAMQSVCSLANTAVFNNFAYPDQWNAPRRSGSSCGLNEEHRYRSAASRANLTRNIWGGYLGEFGAMDAHSRREEYQTTMHGLFVGTDWQLSRNTIFGIYGGFMDETLKYGTINSRVDSDGMQIGIFGHRHLGNGNVLSADFGYAHFDNGGRRILGGFAASSEFDQDVTTFGLGWKKQSRVGFFEISPFANLRYTYLDQGKMYETGSSATVMVLDDMDGNSFVSRLGTGFAKRRCGWETSLDIAWAHEYGDTELSSVGMYQLGGGAFNVSSAVLDRDWLEVGVKLGKDWRNRSSRWGLNFGYNLAAGENTTLHAVSTAASVLF